MNLYIYREYTEQGKSSNEISLCVAFAEYVDENVRIQRIHGMNLFLYRECAERLVHRLRIA